MSTTETIGRKKKEKKKILKGYIKTHHNYKVRYEEKGNATGVAQKACKG